MLMFTQYPQHQILSLTPDPTLMEAPEATLLQMLTMAAVVEEFSAHILTDHLVVREVAEEIQATTTTDACQAPALTMPLTLSPTTEIALQPRTKPLSTTVLALNMDSTTPTVTNQRRQLPKTDTTDQSWCQTTSLLSTSSPSRRLTLLMLRFQESRNTRFQSGLMFQLRELSTTEFLKL